jgi:hypothetical protein
LRRCNAGDFGFAQQPPEHLIGVDPVLSIVPQPHRQGTDGRIDDRVAEAPDARSHTLGRGRERPAYGQILAPLLVDRQCSARANAGQHGVGDDLEFVEDGLV